MEICREYEEIWAKYEEMSYKYEGNTKNFETVMGMSAFHSQVSEAEMLFSFPSHTGVRSFRSYLKKQKFVTFYTAL